MALKMINFSMKVDEEDWLYLRAVCKKADVPVSGLMRDFVKTMAAMYREVLGEDLDNIKGTQEMLMRKMVRTGLYGLADLMEEAEAGPGQ